LIVNKKDINDDNLIKNDEVNIQIQSSSTNNNEEQTKEVLDANTIEVTISEPAPIVILFGARASGKTMTLVRLTRYLRKNGYSVEPDRIFRPSHSKHYEEMCNTFDKNVNSNNAAVSNSILNFMLLKVRESGGGPMVCQILEAPGEHYFEPDNNNDFPSYIQKITKRSNHRTWIFFVELDWQDDLIRKAYELKVAKMRNLIKDKDKIILMCHKADLQMDTHYYKGFPVKEEFIKGIKNQYPGIFNILKSNIPIIKWFKPYEIDEYVIFSAGSFTLNKINNTQQYVEGEDVYPRDLWKAIKKTVRGSNF